MMAFHTNAEDFYNEVSPAEFTVCFHMLNPKTGKYNEAQTKFEAEDPTRALVRLTTGDFDLDNKIVLAEDGRLKPTVTMQPPTPDPEDLLPPPPPMPHPDDVT